MSRHQYDSIVEGQARYRRRKRSLLEAPIVVPPVTVQAPPDAMDEDDKRAQVIGVKLFVVNPELRVNPGGCHSGQGSNYGDAGDGDGLCGTNDESKKQRESLNGVNGEATNLDDVVKDQFDEAFEAGIKLVYREVSVGVMDQVRIWQIANELGLNPREFEVAVFNSPSILYDGKYYSLGRVDMGYDWEREQIAVCANLSLYWGLGLHKRERYVSPLIFKYMMASGIVKKYVSGRTVLYASTYRTEYHNCDPNHKLEPFHRGKKGKKKE